MKDDKDEVEHIDQSEDDQSHNQGSPQTEQPPTQSPAPTDSAVQNRPPKNTSALVIIIIGIVVLIATAVCVYFLLRNNDGSSAQTAKTDSSKTNSSTSSSDVDTTDDNSIVKSVEASINKEFSSDDSLVQISFKQSSAKYIPSGANYSISSDSFGSTLYITIDTSKDRSLIDSYSPQIHKIILDKLSALKLVEQKSNFNTEGMITLSNKDVICNTDSQGSGSPLYLSCTKIADYTELSDAIKPFAKAYIDHVDADGELPYGSSGYIMNFGVKNIQDLQTETRVAMSMSAYGNSVGGFVGLFYKVGDTWKYFTGTQELVPCSEYSTRELQQVYEGADCYNDQTQKYDIVKVTP